MAFMQLYNRIWRWLMLTALLNGCAYTVVEKSFTAYEGEERPLDEIAVLDCNGLCHTLRSLDAQSEYGLAPVDGVFSGESVRDVYLEPGEYRI
jgi:hypothetical protein